VVKGYVMNRFFYAAKAILLGLLTTQILATLHVYLSNADLYRTVTTIIETGYLAIPNEQVMHRLKEFGPAFFGGCFFTLSIGAGLSVSSFACAWLWACILRRNRLVLLLTIALWLGVVVTVNSRGFSLVVTSYLLAVPPVVFIFSLKWMPKKLPEKVWLSRLAHLLPIVMLAILWTVQADQLLFLNIRDYLLLSNPMGKKFNDLYYRYTLYPAQVFKSLDQKTLRACRLQQVKDKAAVRRLASELVNYDYLPVAAAGPVDLEILESNNTLLFNHKGKTVLKATPQDFFAQPKKVLSNFSIETDRHVRFRQATILSLLIGFPVTLYVIGFALLRFVLGFFVGPRPSSITASALCFLVGLSLLVPFRSSKVPMDDAARLSEALNSKSWQQRVGALRIFVEQRLEIGNLDVYRRVLKSPHVPERYWLAKALGVSRQPQTYQDLLALLDDPHPNVASMAFRALGTRGDNGAVQEIITRIKTSDHWYVQWYAYRALRRLGWKQAPRLP
jgi:hypothetical protein